MTLLETSMAEELAKLNPVVAIALIIGICGCICVFIWQIWKTVREN